MDYSKLKTADIIHLNNKELSEYIYSIQDQLQMKLSSGLSIDDIIEPADARNKILFGFELARSRSEAG